MMFLPLFIMTPSGGARRAWASRPALRAFCFVVAGGGVIVAVAGMLRLSLPLMGAGAALWVLGVIVWERATGRFH